MILFYILLAIAPFQNPPIISRFLGDTTTFKIIGGFCVIYALVEMTRKGYVPAYFRSWQARLFAALLVLATVSFLTRGLGHFFESRKSVLLIYVDFAIFFFVTLTLINSPRRLRWVLMAMAAGIAYGSADAIRYWHAGGFSLYTRVGDSVTDMDYFTTAAALALPFVLLMVFHAKRRWEKLLFSGWFLLCLAAVILSGSRGGFVAVSVSLIYLLAHLRHRARNFILVGLLVLPPLIWLPTSPLQRFLHPVNESGVNTEETRILAWKAGLRMYESHPFFGVGLGNFKPLMPLYADPGLTWESMAHNTYIEYLAEMGPAGLLLFLAIAGCALRSLRRVRKRTRSLGLFPDLYVAALALESGLVGYLAGAFFLSAEYEKLPWVVIFLSICLPRLVRSRERVEVEPPVVDVSPVYAGDEESSQGFVFVPARKT